MEKHIMPWFENTYTVFVEKSFGNCSNESLRKRLKTCENRLVECETHCTGLGPPLVLYEICNSVTVSFLITVEY
jgi:hypothetical protein